MYFWVYFQEFVYVYCFLENGNCYLMQQNVYYLCWFLKIYDIDLN